MVFNTSVTYIKVHGLKENTVYEIKAKIVYHYGKYNESNLKLYNIMISILNLDKFVGKGSESQPEFVTTLPTSPPTNTKCILLSPTKVKCSWQKPNYMARGLDESYAYYTNITSIVSKSFNLALI